MTHMLRPYALAIIRNQNHILLLKRSSQSSYAPNHYSLIGGGVEKHETFKQGLIRELEEEISIKV